MPQIQIIDNPYADSIKDAATGLNALTQSREALLNRRREEWRQIQDLPRDVRRVARQKYAESVLGVDGDIVPPEKILAPAQPKKVETGGGLAAVEKDAPKQGSLLGRFAAMFAPDPLPAENPNYAENRVGKSTVEKLGGTNAALGKDLSDADVKEILSRGGKGLNYNGVMTNIEKGVAAPEYTLNGRAAPDAEINAMSDRSGEAEMLASSADPGAYKRALNANINKYRNNETLGPEESEEFFQFSKRLFPAGDGMAAGNIDKVARAYAAMKTPSGGASGYPVTETQRGPGAEIYDDSAIAAAETPAGVTPTPPVQMAGGRVSVGQSRGSSFRGNQGSQYGIQGGVSDEDVANIDFLANDWAGNQDGQARAMLYAKRIQDPNAQHAAVQYVNSLFPDKIAPYDNGTTKERIQMSERDASRSSSGGGGNLNTSGLGTDGFMIINGNWHQVFHANTKNPDLKAVAALMSVKYGVNDHAYIMDQAKKTMEMVAQGDPTATNVLKKARQSTALVTGKLQPAYVAEKNAVNDQTKGIPIGGDTFDGIDYIAEGERAEGDRDSVWHPFGPNERAITRGQIVAPQEAALVRGARKKETKTPSSLTRP